ncbi:hypothetical protein Glove_48g85 [Diversispora epigaea]|uniref:Uncharacterized protein n=1 Tax=Diversispora epigaea TaxID=1348612 RepID=A0A397JKZ2_9GLOM|nr:hypothetical protein Glove_48g85 [Diversispora epigaea]
MPQKIVIHENIFRTELGNISNVSPFISNGEQNNLGECYNHIIGTIKGNRCNLSLYNQQVIGTTKEWYLKAAEGGNKFGQNSIKHCYRNEIEISN